MKVSPSIKPFIWGAVCAVVAMPFALTYGFGYYMPSSAEALAVAREQKMAVPLLAELCAMKFNAQSDVVVAAKKAFIKNASSSYAKGEQLDKAWVTLPGSRWTNDKVIEACAEQILADSSKAAALKQ